MKHRAATRDDLHRWFGRVPNSMRALVLEHDGEIVGVAGIALMGDHLQAFSSQKDGARGRVMAMGRMAVDFAKMLRTAGGPVFALCSQSEPTAPGLLSHLGFAPVNERMWRYG